jgi:cellobiose phosphorylase
MYRLVVESLLGLSLADNRLRFTPCLPAHWTAFSMRYRYHATEYDIAVRQTGAGAGTSQTSVTVDGVAQPDASVPLVDDRATHRVVVDVRVPGA